MAKRFRGSRRRTLSSLTVVALLALAVGVSQGLAGARGSGQATAPIQYRNANCGFDTGAKFVGKARLTRSGSTLTIKVSLNGADPGHYTVYLYDGECSQLENLGKLKVDSSGSGSKVFTTCCYSKGQFFVTPHNDDNNNYNDSLIVTV